MLIDYLQRIRFLLADESFARFSDFTFRRWVNEGRGQIAGEGECLVNYATLQVDQSAQDYAFSAITLSPGTQGVAGPLAVRKASWTMPAGDGGQTRMTGREWEWFENFVLDRTPPEPGQPRYWSQLGQGAAGTLWINPVDGPYALRLDVVCYPSPLLVDSDPEALPYPWTDAVPYYAAYLAYVHAQDPEKATAMMQLYQSYTQRARASVTSSVLPGRSRQGPDLFMANRLGIAPQARGQ